MVDSEYGTDNYKSSKISIGAIIKNPEMLQFVPDHLNIKKMWKIELQNWFLWYRYVPDQHKNQKMCYEAILKNGLHQSLFLIDIRPKKCVIQLLIIMLMH